MIKSFCYGLTLDTGKVRDKFGGMGRFEYWLIGKQCAGVNCITIREYSSICLYYIYITY